MVSTPGFEHGPQFGGGDLLLPLITLVPLGLGHKATKGSVEFNMSVFWITLMICSNFILQRDVELLSFLAIVLAVKNRKWKPGSYKLWFLEIIVHCTIKIDYHNITINW